MSEQEFELYLRLLSRCLNLTAGQREQIADEFRDHLEERLEELARAGVPREKAVFQALDEFGDAAVLAAHFSTIARLKRRRFLMRLSLGSVTALAAAILVAVAFWPQNGPVQVPQPLFAQNKASERKVNVSKAALPKSHDLPRAAEPPLSSDVGDYARFEQTLDQTVDFVVDPEPLKDAIEFISQRYQLPILFDMRALENSNVDLSTEVKMPVAGMKLRQMLRLLLAQMPTLLVFDLQDGVMQITTREVLNDRRVVVVYDCRDLMNLQPAIPAMGVQQRPNGGKLPGAGMFQFGGETSEKAKEPAGGKTAQPAEKNSEQNAQRAQTASGPCTAPVIPLISVIKYAGDEDDWKGDEASPMVTELGGLLVVKQTPLVHEQIKRILADLRRMRKEGAFATLDKEPIRTAAAVPVVKSPKDK